MKPWPNLAGSERAIAALSISSVNIQAHLDRAATGSLTSLQDR
jgi:hypothetical protein